MIPFGRQFVSFLQKLNTLLPGIQQLCSVVFIQGIENLGPHKNLHTDGYSSCDRIKYIFGLHPHFLTYSSLKTIEISGMLRMSFV